MIPCQKCGADNPLGTVFCHSCGTRLEVSLNAVAGSVAATNVEKRKLEIFKAGRNGLFLAACGMVVALVFSHVFAPSLPSPTLNPPASMGPNTLLPEPETWQPDASSVAWLTPDPLPQAIETKGLSLAEWRRRVGRARVQALGVDMSTVRAWHQHILDQQQDNGSFAGNDPVAATGLALLALKACITGGGDEAFLQRKVEAMHQATLYLLQRVRSSAFGITGTPLGRTLAVLALIDAGMLPVKEFPMHQVYLTNGKIPVFQALGLLSIPPTQRPRSTTAVVNRLGGQLLYDQFLSLISDVEQDLDPKFFTAEVAEGLDGRERLVWAATAWFHGVQPMNLHHVLAAWSRTAPADAPEDLQNAAPAFAAQALAVLTCTVAARAPLTWVDRES